MNIGAKFRFFYWQTAVGAIVASLALGPSAVWAQTPSTGAKEFEFKDFGFWAEQCRTLTSEKMYQQALEACEKAIPLNTEKKKAKQQQATLDLWKLRSHNLFQLEQYQPSINSYDYVLRIQPAYSMGWLYRCDGLMRLGQFEAALDSCEKALSVDGDWGESNPTQAWLLQARASYKLGRFDDAIDAYDRVLAMRDNDPVIKAERCSTMIVFKTALENTKNQSEPNSIRLQANNLPYDPNAEVATCLETLKQNDIKVKGKPDINQGITATVWYERGLTFQIARQDTEARQAFNQAVKLYEMELTQNASDPIAWLNQGKALAFLYDYAQSLASYERVIQLRPQWSIAWVGKCRALNYLKQFEAALVACDQAVQGDQKWGQDAAAIWVERAYAVMGGGRYEEAIAVADRAIRLDRKHPRALYVRAFSLWGLGDQNNALNALQQIDALDYQAVFLKGRILSQKGKYIDALGAYKQAISQYEALGQPQDSKFLADLYTNQAAVSYRIGLPSPGIAQKAVALNPGSYNSQLNLGLNLLLAGGDYCPALGAFQQALQLRPNDLSATTGLGRTLAALQRSQEAIGVLRTALNIRPGYEPARSKLVELLEQEASAQRAARRAAKQRVKLIGKKKDEPEKVLPVAPPSGCER
jgi:tetratricopeptide (TPR) repeat protein